MTRDTKLSQDLAALAAAERQRLGEPPSLERLRALRDGELSSEEADRIRDRLAIDPELAAVYLELTGDSVAETQPIDEPDDLLEVDVDDAWRKLSPRLDREPPQIADTAYDDAEGVVSFPRRGWPGILGLAATLTRAVGLVWLWGNRGAEAPTPEGYYPVSIAGLLRDSRLTLPSEATGIAFQIDASTLNPDSYIVELLDAEDQVVRQERHPVAAEQEWIDFGVPLDSLKPHWTYKLVVRETSASSTDSPRISITVVPVFETRPRASGQVEIQDSCEALTAQIVEARKLRAGGERQAAETIYERALKKARAQNCQYQEARIWNGLATMATLEGRLFDALDLLDQATSVTDVSEPEAFAVQARIEFNRAATYLRLNWLDEAEQGFKKVEVLYRLLGVRPDLQGRLLLQQARIARLQGDVAEAKTRVEGALKLPIEDTKLRASLWQESAWLDFGDDRLENAERALEKAIEALSDSDTYAKANVFVDMAELRLRQEKWGESLRWVDKTLALAGAADKPDFNLETAARHVRSVALDKLGELEEAKRAADRGLALLEALRDVWHDQGLHFFALRQKHYRHRLDLAVAAGDPEDAWRIFEGYRAQSLLESTNERIHRKKSGESRPTLESAGEIDRVRHDLLDAIRQLERPPSEEDPRYTYQEARLLELRLKLRDLQDDARQHAGLTPLPPAVDPRQAADLLEAGTLGIVFASGLDRFHAVILDPRRGLRTDSLDADRVEIERLAVEILRGLDPIATAKTQRRLDSKIRELSVRLLLPLEDYLDDSRRLVIIAESPLDKLPFEVLHHPRTGQHLIHSHEISYLPSFSVLDALRRHGGTCTPPRSEILAMADPVFGREDPRWPEDVIDPRNPNEARKFQRLPGTQIEVTRIAEHYGVIPIAGPDVTRKRFLTEAPVHRVIHIASHAESDRQIPERSRIALSCIDAEGLFTDSCDLYLIDVLSLELCGQTIVLSACKTAGGLSVEGEGILGLPWAFLRAGASTVVASLWQVTDGATAELMSTFHRHLRGGMDPDRALRQAKLALIRGHHPSSAWAPFILLGDGRAANSPSTFPARSGPMHQTD